MRLTYFGSSFSNLRSTFRGPSLPPLWGVEAKGEFPAKCLSYQAASVCRPPSLSGTSTSHYLIGQAFFAPRVFLAAAARLVPDETVRGIVLGQATRGRCNRSKLMQPPPPRPIVFKQVTSAEEGGLLPGHTIPAIPLLLTPFLVKCARRWGDSHRPTRLSPDKARPLSQGGGNPDFPTITIVPPPPRAQRK